MEHLGRYRMSVREVIARLFFEGHKGRASGALGKLQRQQRIQIREDGLPQGYSYYQLTSKSCQELGVPEDRAKPLNALPLSRSLGALWFATMKGATRALLSSDRLPPHYPATPGKATHVGEVLPSGDGRIYRLHVASEDKDYFYPLSAIQKVMVAMTKTPEGMAFVSSGYYAFAVLVNDEAKQTRFEEALVKYRPKFTPGAIVIVETVPSPANFPSFVSRHE